MNRITENFYNWSLILLIFSAFLFVFINVIRIDNKKIESQILCLKTHGARKCMITNPSNEVWNICIQHNPIEYCGARPFK